jgi:prophage maintenance system killer protein
MPGLRGKTDYDELTQAAKTAETEAIQAMGFASELRFDKYLAYAKSIKNVRDASCYEDAFEAIDKWLEYENSRDLPELPVQIKSSFKDVREFRKNTKYKQRNGIEIVVNCGPSIKYKGLMRQLLSEKRRIRNLLKAYQTF